MIPTMSAAASIVVGAILLVSGLAKLLSIPRFRDVLMETYGFDTTWAKRASVGTPLSEILVGTLVLIPQFRAEGFVIAVCLFVAMAGIVALALTDRRTGDCGCLGQLHSSQLSRWTILRLIGLAIIAALGGLSMTSTSLLPGAAPWPILFLVGLAFVMALVLIRQVILTIRSSE